MDIATLGNALQNVDAVSLDSVCILLSQIYVVLRIILFLHLIKFMDRVFKPLFSIMHNKKPRY